MTDRIDIEDMIYQNLSLEDMIGEVWHEIKGYELRYQVSNYGRVKSLQYYANRNKQGIISQVKDKQSGYLHVLLSNGKRNKAKTFKVHRLVADAFIDNPYDLPQVNHINGNKQDNRVENLEWCDKSYNMRHSYKTGLRIHKNERHGKPIKITMNDGTIRLFARQKDAASFLGVKPATIWSKITGRSGNGANAKVKFNAKYVDKDEYYSKEDE